MQARFAVTAIWPSLETAINGRDRRVRQEMARLSRDRWVSIQEALRTRQLMAQV
jgi:hypothetical protein